MRTYPRTRMRRNRSNAAVRTLAREHQIIPEKLIWPLFIQDSPVNTTAITAMPGVNCLNLETTEQAVKRAINLGLAGVMLFPRIRHEFKDETGSHALDQDNIVAKALHTLQPYHDQINIICDCALDPYTSHGHDGVLNSVGQVDNDASLTLLAEQAEMLAALGCTTIAPSDMMDGRIAIIRDKLDKAGYHQVRLMSYAVKYASSFYGPFRDAIKSHGLLSGDKKTYQMDFHNSKEAIHEASIDLGEGADWLIVKPGMPYLDVLAALVTTLQVPTFAYQVSGEYAMLKHLMQQQPDKANQLLTEALAGFFRAGASGVISYFAADYANLLQQSRS